MVFACIRCVWARTRHAQVSQRLSRPLKSSDVSRFAVIHANQRKIFILPGKSSTLGAPPHSAERVQSLRGDLHKLMVIYRSLGAKSRLTHSQDSPSSFFSLFLFGFVDNNPNNITQKALKGCLEASFREGWGGGGELWNEWRKKKWNKFIVLLSLISRSSLSSPTSSFALLLFRSFAPPASSG